MGKHVRTAVVVGATVALWSAAACGGGGTESADPSPPQEEATSPAAAPEKTPEDAESEDAESQEQRTEDRQPRDGELVRAGSAASTPREKAVAEAWFSYLAEVVRVMNVPDASGLGLTGRAIGGAVEGPQGYAEDLTERGVRLTGGMAATLQEVEISGTRATVRGCVKSTMFEVDAKGKPLEETVPWFRATHSLWWDGGIWLVERHDLEQSTKCV